METHIFAVWDFMSLVKSLQHHVCPSTDLWVPIKGTRNGTARFLNEIVLSEESDEDLNTGAVSHFDLYLQSMYEVGADTTKILKFLELINSNGFESSMLYLKGANPVAYEFVSTTFGFISSEKPHIIASAFLHGREGVIPEMFSKILNRCQIDAPKFKYYLERHIELDGDEHGPAAVKLLDSLCEGDPLKVVEAERAAYAAIEARIQLLDGIFLKEEKIPNPFRALSSVG